MKRWLAWLALVPGVVLVFVPVAALAVLSFCKGRFPALPWPGWTLAWYGELAGDAPLRDSLGRSVAVGLAAGTLATALGFGSGYGLARLPGRVGKPLLLALTLPALIPYVLFGFCFLEFARYAGLARTMAGIVVAHTVIFSPVSAALVFHRCRQMSAAAEDAARELGASQARVLVQIVGSQAWRTLAASLIVVFVLSWDEYVVAWFVSGFGKTYPVQVRNMLESTMSPEVDAIGTVVALVSCGLMALALWLLRARQEGGEGA